MANYERPPLWQRKQVRPYDRLRRPLPPATLRRILEKNGLREGHHYAVVSHQELTGKKTPNWGMGRTFWNVVAGGILTATHLPFFEVVRAIYEDVERKELLKLKGKLREQAETTRLKYRRKPEYAVFSDYGREIFLLSRDAAVAVRALKKYKATVNIWGNDPQPYKYDDPYGWLRKL